MPVSKVLNKIILPMDLGTTQEWTFDQNICAWLVLSKLGGHRNHEYVPDESLSQAENATCEWRLFVDAGLMSPFGGGCGTCVDLCACLADRPPLGSSTLSSFPLISTAFSPLTSTPASTHSE